MNARIGIDVGGTFTKAVAVAASDGSLIEKATVPTSHNAEQGVAEGVVRAFKAVLAKADLQPSSVELVVLSTTQAVNALLEGDVAPVGIVGIGDRTHRRHVERLTRVGPVSVTPERNLPIYNEILLEEELTPQSADAAVGRLKLQGAEAIAVSAAYGVEDSGPEKTVLEAAERAGIPATGGHEMTGLYGLEVRTFTAAVNASILPRMTQVIDWVRKSMLEAEVGAPLMVVNGTMELVSADEARKHPAATLLSGPAASVAGASLYHQLLDGFFMEVGGTSTNIGVLRSGRPVMKYVSIMDYPTCLRSMDVRVAGVAGGSMVRVRDKEIADVGPRSAHIAGLPYACFADPEELTDGRLQLISPREGDPAEYAVIVTRDGDRYAVTLTDAANALGEISPDDNAHGSQESARLALGMLAQHLGSTIDDVAGVMLGKAVDKLMPVLRRMGKEYRLRSPELVGLGGAASVLVPRAASAIGSGFQVVPHAEVISSIGAAMTPVGVEMERNLMDESPEGLCHFINEARVRARGVGASQDTVHIDLEPIPERSAFRVRAKGAPLGSTAGIMRKVYEPTARMLAGHALKIPADSLRLAFENDFFRVYEGERSWGVGPIRRSRKSVAVVDYEGVVRFEANDPLWATSNGSDIDGALTGVRQLDSPGASASRRLVALVGPHMLSVPDQHAAGLDMAVHELDPEGNVESVAVLSGRIG